MPRLPLSDQLLKTRSQLSKHILRTIANPDLIAYRHLQKAYTKAIEVSQAEELDALSIELTVNRANAEVKYGL